MICTTFAQLSFIYVFLISSLPPTIPFFLIEIALYKMHSNKQFSMAPITILNKGLQDLVGSQNRFLDSLAYSAYFEHCTNKV